jgi:hypothetical protein
MLGRSLLMKASGARLLYPAYVQDYLDRVTAADVAAGSTLGLERGVTDGFNVALQDLVADTILGVSGNVIAQAPSISKAMSFLCGARTLSGCLVPVVGPAPTNFNFTGPRYNRKTGLQGDGATTYLDSNRNNDADPQNSRHFGLYVSTASTQGVGNQYIGTQDATGGSLLGRSGIVTNLFGSLSNQSGEAFTNRGGHTGFVGLVRNSSASIAMRSESTQATSAVASQTPRSESILVFARPGSPAQAYSNARISSYSIGESLDLAVLDARISTLMATLAAVLP